MNKVHFLVGMTKVEGRSRCHLGAYLDHVRLKIWEFQNPSDRNKFATKYGIPLLGGKVELSDESLIAKGIDPVKFKK